MNHGDNTNSVIRIAPRRYPRLPEEHLNPVASGALAFVASDLGARAGGLLGAMVHRPGIGRIIGSLGTTYALDKHVNLSPRTAYALAGINALAPR